jgi:hypothetical protein
MNSGRIFAFAASILLISLGLGIVYLATTERLSVPAAVAIVVAAAAFIPAAVTLHDLMRK